MKRVLRWLAALAVALAVFAPAASSALGGTVSEQSAAEIPYIRVDELPHEARATLELIERGGPFPYDRDGIVFRNFEKRLPLRERGYYREYTVKTPGVSHRGARRIVAGRGGERYYTDDHYKSFKRIRK